MLGAIVGDIIGSVREGRKSQFNAAGLIESTQRNGTITPLPEPEAILHPGLSFTDDSVLTLATDKALREGQGIYGFFAKQYASFFDMHSEPNAFYLGPGIGYGMMFMEWASDYLQGNNPKGVGYNSYGNGSAMRVSPVAYQFDSMLDVINAARQSAICTHSHPEGVVAAQIVALCIWAARMGASVEELRELVTANYAHSIDFDEGKLIRNYVFSPLAQSSVPQAIWAALEGPDFHSVMIRCLKIGGDTDTICAIAGSIAEPLWGLPEDLAKQSLVILKRDGPFLYDEYARATGQNVRYPQYTEDMRSLPVEKLSSKMMRVLFSWQKKA
jgi:ADP-ribosyl-[dinitrogen reductase] hydrolase